MRRENGQMILQEQQIPLPKKNNAVNCSDYRTISLICHASKIMLKMLTKRIEAKAKHLLGRNQFEFRKGCETRDAVGVMRTLCERSLECGNEVYIYALLISRKRSTE